MNKEEQNYLKSIELFDEQIKQSYQEAKAVKLPKSYRQVNKIVTCGMGGSQLGVDVVRHLFSQNIKVPLTQIRGYQLPKFVDSQTLVFLLSYSGGTEEILSIMTSDKCKMAKRVVISAGGKLAQLAKKYKVPSYIFNPLNNPSGQPRMGTGYMMGALSAFLKKLKLIDIGEGLIKKITNYQLPITNVEIQRLSQKLKNKIPVLVASEHLQGHAHVMANQLNESAKQLALYYSIPELNHHLMEGLTFPRENKKLLYFVFFYSKYYQVRNQKRYKITQQVLTKQKIKYLQLELPGDKVTQAMCLLKLGGYLSYYLAKLNQVNPNQTPWVNFFKKRLKD